MMSKRLSGQARSTFQSPEQESRRFVQQPQVAMTVKRQNFEKAVQRLEPINKSSANMVHQKNYSIQPVTAAAAAVFQEKTRSGMNRLDASGGAGKLQNLKFQSSMSTGETSQSSQHGGSSGKPGELNFFFNRQALSRLEDSNHLAPLIPNQAQIDKLKYLEEGNFEVGTSSMNRTNEFINKVKRVTSASKRRIKLRSMHDIAQFAGNSDGAKATTSYLNEDITLTAQVSPSNFNQSMFVGDKLNGNISLRTKVTAVNSGLNGGFSSTISQRQSLSLNKGSLRIQLASPEDMNKKQNFQFGASRATGIYAQNQQQQQMSGISVPMGLLSQMTVARTTPASTSQNIPF